MASSFKKGMLVQPIKDPPKKHFYYYRKIYPSELSSWFDEPENQGMGDDGESKLPPRLVGMQIPAGFFTVVRAAVAPPDGYKCRGWFEITNMQTGENWWAMKVMFEEVKSG